ncbi:hypothetical protein BLOT_004078 [Blomia tropicalis]|nr:hypothetical protein BLOT_004078 [Blomia tropicalis]
MFNVVCSVKFKLRLSCSTRNVRGTSLNFDNLTLPIHYRNDEIGSSNRVKCIIMSLNASSKPVLYQESLALKQQTNIWST